MDGGVVGVLQRQSPEPAGGLIELSRVAEGLCLLQLLEQQNPVFRIRQRSILRRGRFGSTDVAKRSQAFERRGIDLRGRRLVTGLQQVHGVQVRAERRGDVRVLFRDIAALLGVRTEIVELGPRRVDELPAPGFHGHELAPAEVKTRVVRFSVRHRADEGIRLGGLSCRRRTGRRGDLVRHHRQQADAVQSRWHGDPHEVEQRWREVDQTRQTSDSPPGERQRGRADRAADGRRDDQRNVERGAVQEDPMGRLAVLAERLAVVGRVHHCGVASKVERVQPFQQPQNLGVGVHDLARVGAGGALAVLGGRTVRLVRIVQMDPQVERTLAAVRLPEPRQRGVHRRARGALDGCQIPVLDSRVVERVVVGLMPLADAPARMEDIGRDEPRGVIAVREKTLREGRGVFSEHEAAVVAYGVVGRIEAGEEGTVRGQRQRDLGHRTLEQHPLACESRGRNRLERPAVGSNVVTSQGVDRDNDHVGVRETRPADRPVLRHPNAAGQRGGWLRRPLGLASSPDVGEGGHRANRHD